MTHPFTLADVMTKQPHTIGVNQPLSAAHQLMRKYEIRHLPVLSGGKLVGLVSDRDLSFIESLPDVDPEKITVEDAMSQEVYTTAPQARLADVASVMASGRYGSAVVIDNDHVVGIFTTVDALRVLSKILTPAK